MPGYIKKLRGMSPTDRATEIDRLISETFGEICDDETFNSVAATTNAGMWGGDVYEVIGELSDDDLTGDEVKIDITYSATGDQDEEKPFNGDVIKGTAVAVIDDDGGVTYEDVTAEIDQGGDDDDLSDEPDIYVEDEEEDEEEEEEDR